jgi:hypothetical protein
MSKCLRSNPNLFIIYERISLSQKCIALLCNYYRFWHIRNPIGKKFQIFYFFIFHPILLINKGIQKHPFLHLGPLYFETGRITIPQINTKLYSVPRIIVIKIQKDPSTEFIARKLNENGLDCDLGWIHYPYSYLYCNPTRFKIKRPKVQKWMFLFLYTGFIFHLILMGIFKMYSLGISLSQKCIALLCNYYRFWHIRNPIGKKFQIFYFFIFKCLADSDLAVIGPTEIGSIWKISVLDWFLHYWPNESFYIVLTDLII